jgi:uncharacterized membrane protein
MDKLLSMDKPIFSVTISPHRSLPPKGFAILLTAIAFINLTGGIVLWHIGAWPVIGFMGLDVALIWFALRWNYRQADRHEQVTVTAAELRLDRYFRDKLLEQIALPRGFAYVDLEQDQERDLTGRLWLRSKGKSYEIGSFLGAHERLALAHALRKALTFPAI